MKATVKLELRKDYVRKDGHRPLCLRYTAYRKTTLISLNISLLPKHWNENCKNVRSGNPHCYEYNKLISEIYQKATQLHLDHFYHPLTVKEFKKKLFVAPKEEPKEENFYEFILPEIELEKPFKSKGTISNYLKLTNTMKLWKPELTFEEIDLDFIKHFHKHELDVGNELSTIYKKHSNLKFLLGLAVKKKKLAENPYQDFSIKRNIKAQNNDVLTEEEIQKLQQIYDQKKYKAGKQEVLREFLFACYTGLSYAEYAKVTYSDIKLIKLKDGSVYPLLANERNKTDVPYKIPIVSPVVMNLLGNGEGTEKIFSPLTNQPTNRYLKQIMKEACIHKEMTFHRGRHTFRTIAARKGISDNIAERMMGHAEGNDIKDIYTHRDDADIVQEVLGKWVV